MASEHCGEDMLGKLVRWFEQSADPLFGTFDVLRPLLRKGWRLLGLAQPETRFSLVARARAARSRVFMRGASFVFPMFLYATVALNGHSAGGEPPRTEPVRVMIVDDHPIIRRGLALSLRSSPDFEVIGEAATGEEAIELIEQVHPDVILMDLVMPGMKGEEAIRIIHEAAPDIKIIVFSNFEEGDRVEEAFQAGANSYLLKDIEIDKLLDAIRQAVSGVASLAPKAAKSLIEKAKMAPKLGYDLTDREREVLALLVQGRSNGAISTILVIQPATVKFHLRNIRSKLGTSNRTETVIVALRHGLVPPGH